MENLTETQVLREDFKGTQLTKSNITLGQVLLVMPFVLSGPVDLGTTLDLHTTNSANSYSTYSLSQTYSVDEQLTQIIYEIHSALVSDQLDIDEESRSVLASNLWDLYS